MLRWRTLKAEENHTDWNLRTFRLVVQRLESLNIQIDLIFVFELLLQQLQLLIRFQSKEFARKQLDASRILSCFGLIGILAACRRMSRRFFYGSKSTKLCSSRLSISARYLTHQQVAVVLAILLRYEFQDRCVDARAQKYSAISTQRASRSSAFTW